jgi:hypothetical protein
MMIPLEGWKVEMANGNGEWIGNAKWLKAGPGDQAHRPRRQAAGEGRNPRKAGAWGEYLFI